MSSKSEKIEKVKCLTHPFRVSYPKVFKAEKYDDNQDAKYSLVMLFPKKTDNGKPADGQKNSLEQIIKRAAIEKFGKKENWPKKLKMPLKDGDVDSEAPEYKGMMYATISSKKKPILIDLQQGNAEILDEEDFYAGCWARAVVIAGGFDNKSKGVTLTVMSIQKLKDDEAFAGGQSVEAAVNEFNSSASGFEIDDDEDEDEDEKPKVKKKKKKEPELEEDDEDDSDEDDDSDDEDEDESDDEDDSDEDEDEENEPVFKKKKKPVKEVKKKKKK